MDTKSKNGKKDGAQRGASVEGSGFAARIRASFAERAGASGGTALTLFLDLATFVFSYLLATQHLAFGSYPLAVGWLASLPSRVWISLAGAVVGAVSLGSAGVIYAMVCLLTVLLRIVISGGEKTPDGERLPLFSEGLFLRVSSALIGGFVLFAYALLKEGMTLSAAAFGLVSVFAPSLVCVVLSGLFEGGVGIRDFLFGNENFFSVLPPALERAGRRKKRGERNADVSEPDKKDAAAEQKPFPFAVFRFSLALASLVFLFSYTQDRIDLFGIRFSLVAAALSTLFFAKRFGAPYGAAAGFFSSIGLSPTLALAFVLAGLAAGFFFGVGEGIPLFVGGGVLSLFAGYAGGVSGFLAVLPEYALAACLFYPFVHALPTAASKEKEEERTRPSVEMVGAMILSRKCKKTEVAETFSQALSALAPHLHSFSERDLDRLSDDCDLFASMMREMRLQSEREWLPDASRAKAAEEALSSLGVRYPEVRVLGEKRPYVVAAGLDESGEKFSSAELLPLLEHAVGIRLAAPEYYRKGVSVLIETRAAQTFSVTCGAASEAGCDGEASGDSYAFFTTDDLTFYAILSDGEGSGDAAKRTSDFAVKFLSEVLSHGVTVAGALKLLNRILRRRSEECSATVDLFAFDTVSGDACLYKSGASPSYIKRQNRLFRLRSETLPLGILAAMDAEKIRAELEDGDLLIMATDGVCPMPEETPRLLELLGRPTKKTPEEYAAFLLREAEERDAGGEDGSPLRDDKTLLVIRIGAIN